MKGIFKHIYNFVLAHDVWCIVGLGLAVRLLGLFWMGYAGFPEFYRDYYMVSGIAHGTNFTLLGPPSMLGGFHFPPFYYYSMVPLLALFHFHPTGLLATGMVFSALAIYVLYKLLLLWTGEVVFARVGALLAAVSLYGVHLTAYTSNPNFLPLFVLWYFYHLTKVIQQKAGRWDYVWLGVSFALATQLHATAMILLPMVTLLAFILCSAPIYGLGDTAAKLRANYLRFSRSNLSREKITSSTSKSWSPRNFGLYRGFGWSVLVTFGIYLPYFIYDGLHHFSNLRQLFVLGAQNLQGGSTLFSIRALINFLEITLTPMSGWYSYTYLQPNWLYAVVAVLFCAVLLQILYRVLKQQGFMPSTKPTFTREGWVLLWLWLLVQTLVLLLYSKAVHDHYIIILWPWPVVALTWAVWQLKTRLGVYKLAVSVLVLVAGLQLYSFYSRAGGNWDSFFPTFYANYNRPETAEIGAKW